MRLTPLDIRKQEFRKVMRGFDPLEVEAFLDMVADEYDSLLVKRNEYLEKIKDLEIRVKDYEKMEQTLQNSLLEAQDAVSHSKSMTQRESGHLVNEARVEAQQIVMDARNEAARLEREILTLKAQKASFAARLRHILESQVEVIKVLELDDVDLPELAVGRKKIAAARPAGGEPQDVPHTSKPLRSAASVSPRKPEPESAAPSEEPASRNQGDETFTVLGAGAKEEQDLIEKMVLEMEEETGTDAARLDDDDVDAAVEQLARDKARRRQQDERWPGRQEEQE